MRSHSSTHINFNTGKCCETMESKVNYIVNRMEGITNPYTGNKRKIIPKMFKFIEDEGIEYDTVLDLFSGSAYVSMAMKYMGKSVISNDLLRSSYFYAKAFVENDSVELSQEQKKYLLKNKNKNKSDFVKINFSEKFTDNEISFLDNYYANVKDLDNEYEEALAFADIQMYIEERCFLGGFLNHGQIIASRDFRIAHIKNKGVEMPFQNMRWYSFLDDFRNAKPCKSFCEDAISLLESDKYTDKIGLAYIDPPYGGQQSDYGFMYNFLESYVRQQTIDEWNNGFMSRFAKKKTYEDNFLEMIKLLSDVPVLVISYNDSSWSGLDHIKEVLLTVRKEICVKNIEHDCKLRGKNNKSSIEYLIIAR